MSRVRLLMSSAVVLLLGGHAAAQPEPEPKDGKLTLSLTLSPAAPPKPISKYYLIPEYRDQTPGEMLSGFLKCFMEQNYFFNKENEEKRYNWLKMPLAELPADVREQAGIKDGIAYDPPYARLMVFLDQAARMNRIEWNDWINYRHDGIYALLPEVQKLRALAPVLVLRMRGEVKNGEFDRAAVTAKTLLGMARMLQTNPTLIADLVGIAIATMTLNALEEAVQQPGCPDLLWSFTDLPAPLIDIRTGLGGERLLGTGSFRRLLQADRPLTDADLERELKVIDDIFRVNTAESGKKETPAKKAEDQRAGYAAWAKDADRVAAARKRLVELGGFPADRVKDFPPLQVVFTDDVLQVRVLQDEMFKWMNLPYPQRQAGLDAEEERLRKAKDEWVLAPALLPAIMKVTQAQARLDQRVAYLRVIEALRLHAHEHDGKLPGSLDEVKLPIPPDPVSGKPFSYSVKDGVATLTGENPTPGSERTNRVYEIRIRK